MSKEFITTPTFDNIWSKMGLGDQELKHLEKIILENPTLGEVVPGLGGARKIRFALGKGKSGGARVIYVDVVVKAKVHLLLAYPKSIQENLTPTQENIIRKYVQALKKED